jgi:transposase InsO family protein
MKLSRRIRGFSLSDLHLVAGFTKQALHKWRKRQIRQQQEIEMTHRICAQYRVKHKRMSSRKIYHLEREKVPIGRDIFERHAKMGGFEVRLKRSFKRTTIPLKEGIVPNLIEGLTINGSDQVYQSDIFYHNIQGKNHYVFVITDIYTRELLVAHGANNMTASELIKAMEKLVQLKGKKKLKNVIFHSDRGTQYGSLLFIAMCKKCKIKRSMGKRSQQNAYAERIQGIIQYEYLFEMDITSQNLQSQLDKIVGLYNFERPHYSLKKMTPHQFKQEVNKMKESERPTTQVYQWVEPILTMDMLFNKKEKRSKKEKTEHQNN